jgi:hypothetical protein
MHPNTKATKAAFKEGDSDKERTRLNARGGRGGGRSSNIPLSFPTIDAQGFEVLQPTLNGSSSASLVSEHEKHSCKGSGGRIKGSDRRKSRRKSRG